MHGAGRYEFPDGSVYEGEYRNDRRDGNGMMILTNGVVYKGRQVKGKFEGEVEYKYANGKIRKLAFKNGEIVKQVN